MKEIICSIIILFITFIFAENIYAQQYEDVIYLKNGSIIHGIITEMIPGESIKVKTKDGNIFFFKMNEVDKMLKEEISEKPKTDTAVNKNKKNPETKKLPNASNSVTIQPIGLFTLISNIEYDRALSDNFSIGAKVSYMSIFGRKLISFEGTPDDVASAESVRNTLTGWGIGLNVRHYPGERSVEGFFIGLAFEKLSFNYDDRKETDSATYSVKNISNGLLRLEFEIGNRKKFSNSKSGFTFQWTLGGGIGFFSTDKEKETKLIPVGSIGIGIGYSF